jgi:hypothetical protein
LAGKYLEQDFNIFGGNVSEEKLCLIRKTRFLSRNVGSNLKNG